MNSSPVRRAVVLFAVLALLVIFVSDGGNAASTGTSASQRSIAPPRPTIVFARGDTTRDIYVAAPYPTGRQAIGLGPVYKLTRITDHPANDGSPSWSPDGERIVFDSERDNSMSEIYTMKRDGTDIVRLTSNAMYDWLPRWSPNGQYITWMRCVGNGFNIWVMNTDGTNKHQLTYLPTVDTQPDWAPDSQWIVWTSLRDGNWGEIYKIKTDNTGLTRLTNNGADDGQPAWSPDGQRIAFARREPAHEGARTQWKPDHIWVMNADGTGEVQLTHGKAHDHGPRWSADGTQIMFSSTRAGGRHIYRMKADGSDIQPVITSGTDNRYHDWLILR